MTPLSRLAACCFVLLALPGAQNPETVNPDTLLPDDSVALENQIRHSKFDQILPRVMRDNEIDMWIHVMRPWTPDPLGFELGADAGIFIFTDRGEDRIERALFAGNVDDADAYDVIARPLVQRPTFVDGVITEQPGGNETDYLEFRFDGVREFVAQRDPRRIAVNYSAALGLSAASERAPLTDGLSHTDYSLLMGALGDTYAGRVVSAEHLILDYLAGRVAEEIDLYRQFGLIAADNLDREFGKVVPGVTRSAIWRATSSAAILTASSSTLKIRNLMSCSRAMSSRFFTVPATASSHRTSGATPTCCARAKRKHRRRSKRSGELRSRPARCYSTTSSPGAPQERPSIC